MYRIRSGRPATPRPYGRFRGRTGLALPRREDQQVEPRACRPGLFNDYLAAMPGVSWPPHDVRYAFATYGERHLGFAPGEASLILDHMEGLEPENVTSQIYSSDQQISRKR